MLDIFLFHGIHRNGHFDRIRKSLFRCSICIVLYLHKKNKYNHCRSLRLRMRVQIPSCFEQHASPLQYS